MEDADQSVSELPALARAFRTGAGDAQKRAFVVWGDSIRFGAVPICPASRYHSSMAATIRIGADDRSRVPLARLDVLPSQEFLAERQDDGSILLVPVTLIPTRELALWENPELRRSVMTGVAEAAAGLIETDNDFLRDLNASPGADDDEEGE